MSSIPLPALHIQAPAQAPNPMEQYGQLMQLRNQMQNAPLQRQALQQQVQAGQLENQQRQQAVKNQQAITEAYQRWDGKDYNGLAHLALQAGATGDAIQALQQHGLTLRETASKIASQDAATGTKIVETTRQQNQAASGALQGVLNAPEAQMPQALMSTVQQLAQQKKADGTPMLDQQHLQMAQALAQQGPAAIRQALPMFQKDLLAFDQQLEATQKQAQTGEANARANEATVNAQLAPAKLANQQANDAMQRRQGAQRISIEQARLAFEQRKSGLTADGAPDPNAQAIATGHVVPERMSYLLARNPGIIDAVMKLDPSFDSSKAQAYPATYKDFTSGKTSIALNAGGTALTHLKELSDMNTNESHIPGTPGYNAYQNKADTVSSELAKFYGDATIPAIASIKKTLTATLPGNRQAAIQTQAQSMGDKLDSFQQTWDNAAPSKAYQASMPGISQKAIAARAALDPKYKAASGGAPEGGDIPVKAPNGKTYTFKDQASADAFKQKAGIQ